MSLNPLRRVKSLWGRADAATDTVKVLSLDYDSDVAQPGRETNDTLGGEQAQREAQVSEPFHATSINDSQASTTLPLTDAGTTFPEDSSIDDEGESTRLFNETSGSSQKRRQSHARYASSDSDATLDHDNEADDHMHQSQAAGDRQTNVSLGRNREDQVLEVSSDEDGLLNSRTFTEYPSLRRWKLTSQRLFKRTVKKTKYPGKLDIKMEKSTEDNALPEGHLHTYNGVRYSKTFIDLTESCGAAPSLHKLICGHWISTPTPQPCGVTCHSPVFDNEAFRCAECCYTVRVILDDILSAPERAKLAHARSGFRVSYIALVVEYVAKYTPAAVATGGVTEAVLHTLDRTGRACEESDGPVDYNVDVDPVREMWRRAKQEWREEENARVRRGKRERDDEINGAVSLAAQSKKRKTSVRRDGKLIVQRTSGSMHNFADTEGGGKAPKSGAMPTKVLHGGAARSPHISRSGQRFALKRGGQDAEVGQESETGKRRRVL